MALIREAGQDRYVGERCPALEQKFLGAFDSGRDEPAIRWGASGCFECPGELRLGEPNQIGEFLQADVLAEVGLEEFQDPTQLPGRQPLHALAARMFPAGEQKRRERRGQALAVHASLRFATLLGQQRCAPRDLVVVDHEDGLPGLSDLKLIAEDRSKDISVETQSKVPSRFDSVGVPPDAHLGGHEHGMARVEAGAGCRPIHVQPRFAMASDLFEQNRHGRILGGKVVPDPAWAEVLNDMADGDAVPVTALTLHFPDTVGRSKLERWMLFRNRREAHPAQLTKKWIAHNPRRGRRSASIRSMTKKSLQNSIRVRPNELEEFIAARLKRRPYRRKGRHRARAPGARTRGEVAPGARRLARLSSCPTFPYRWRRFTPSAE